MYVQVFWSIYTAWPPLASGFRLHQGIGTQVPQMRRGGLGVPCGDLRGLAGTGLAGHGCRPLVLSPGPGGPTDGPPPREAFGHRCQ